MGVNSTVIDKVVIGDFTKLGSFSLALKDAIGKAVHVGIPAKDLKNSNPIVQ